MTEIEQLKADVAKIALIQGQQTGAFLKILSAMEISNKRLHDLNTRLKVLESGITEKKEG